MDAKDALQSVFRTFFRRAPTQCYQLPGGEEFWKLSLVISLSNIRKNADHHHASKRDVDRMKAIGSTDPQSQEELSTILKLMIGDLIATAPLEHQAVVRDRLDGIDALF